MANYPYTLNTRKLTEFLKHIQKASVPEEKVTHKYLSSAGFRSTNDRRIIPVLKFIDFLDSSGVPTEKYRAFRNTATGPQILGQAIRSAYSDLFNLYPDAQQKDTEALRNFFSTHSQASEAVLSAMVLTFRGLCGMARFDVSEQAPLQELPSEARQQRLSAPRGIESLVINIQLTLPATSDSKIYEEIFRAMKKHLLEGKE